MTNEIRLPVLSLPGLSPDSLGNYLASLGLLRVLARKWPSTRIAWRDEVLQVVGGPTTLDELLDELVRVAKERAWASYERSWLTEQTKGTKLGQNKNTASQAGMPIAVWRAKQSEDAVVLLDSHIVATTRQMFNPLTGNGGSAGNRDFSDGWKLAVDSLADALTKCSAEEDKHNERLEAAEKAHAQTCAKANERYHAALEKAQRARSEGSRVRAKDKAENARNAALAKAREKHSGVIDAISSAFEKKNIERPRDELKNTLEGLPTTWVAEKLNAGSWFSAATKAFNSGQTPARAALCSPWAMALACEGLAFFAGSASRRLGARSRTEGAFPFVTRSAAPETAGEAGRILGEIWTPLWTRPMSLAEASALYLRGRAELDGRGAITPAAFATSIRKRGVDAGISEFRRFTLGRTTSPNTFEPRLEARLSPEPCTGAIAAVAPSLERVTAMLEQRGFPRDRRVGQRWRFEGLRGPIEAALLAVAAEPDCSEAGIALLDAVVTALDRIDRNRSFREAKIRWEPLPLEWLPSLFADDQPGVEASLAMSLVSGFPETLPFAAFRFGVEWAREQNGKYGYDWATQPRQFEHSKVAPARWVWGPGMLERSLAAVLARRLLEEARLDASHPKRPPGRAPLPGKSSHIQQWLTGDLDELLLSAWLSRLALFDWRRVPQKVRWLAVRSEHSPPPADGELAVLGLLQPLIDQRPLIIRDLSPDDLLSEEKGARTSEAAISLVTLIRAGNLDAALRLASSRYAMAGARLAMFDVPFGSHQPDRLAAALLLPFSMYERMNLFTRWLRPRRQPNKGEVNV